MDNIDVDAIAAELLPGWSIWQAHDGHIVIQLKHEDRRECLDGNTLSEVLIKARNYKPLPRVRRCPEPFIVDEWESRKVDKRWEPFHKPRQRGAGCYLKTRRECEETIRRWSEQREKEIAHWHNEIARLFPSGFVEGVDFRWEDQP